MKSWTNTSTFAAILWALALAAGLGCGDRDTGTMIDPATVELVVVLESGRFTWAESGEDSLLAAAMTDPSTPVRFVLKTSDGTTLADIEGSSLRDLRERVADLPPDYFQGFFRQYLAIQELEGRINELRQRVDEYEGAVGDLQEQLDEALRDHVA